MGSKRGLETASIYENWAGHESPLPSTASVGVGRPGGAFAILWWDALNERDLALPHLPTQVTRCPIEIRYGNSNPSHDLTGYCVRPTQYRRGRCDAMRMDARPDLGVEDGLKTVKREHDVAGLVSSVRRPDTRWHPVVGGQKKHGRPGSELWAPGSEL